VNQEGYIIQADGQRRPLTRTEAMLADRLALEMRTGRAWFREWKKQRIQLWASVLANVVMLGVYWFVFN